MKPVIVALDLDGVIADTRAREHLRASRQWDEYDAEAKSDSVIECVKLLLDGLSEETIVVVCSTRKESSRKVINDWLWQHEIKTDHLLLRGDFESGKADETRPRMLLEWAAEEFDGAPLIDLVWFVIEEHPRVADVWASMGLNCFLFHSAGRKS